MIRSSPESTVECEVRMSAPSRTLSLVLLLLAHTLLAAGCLRSLPRADSPGPGTYKKMMDIRADRFRRSYLVHLPPAAAEGRPLPLVVVLHGAFDSGKKMERLTGFSRIADREVAYRTRFEFPAQSTLNPEIERLWAFAAIEDLQHRMDYLGEDADSRQAIVDLAVEYGLVTDYTAMVVVRDEVFDAHGIKRSNQTRLAIEEAARAQRAQRPAVSRRVDSQQPMHSSRITLWPGTCSPRMANWHHPTWRAGRCGTGLYPRSAVSPPSRTSVTLW